MNDSLTALRRELLEAGSRRLAELTHLSPDDPIFAAEFVPLFPASPLLQLEESGHSYMGWSLFEGKERTENVHHRRALAARGLAFGGGQGGWGLYRAIPESEGTSEARREALALFGTTDFITAEGFGGAKPCFTFQLGDKGLGYYLDPTKTELLLLRALAVRQRVVWSLGAASLRLSADSATGLLPIELLRAVADCVPETCSWAVLKRVLDKERVIGEADSSTQ